MIVWKAQRMRAALQRWLVQQGVDVRKRPAGEWQPIDVFKLAAECVMTVRGDSLSFVEIGANDGVWGDPIRDYVLKRGWHGILVEPQPDVFARLKLNYADHADKLIFEQVAIGPEGALTMFRPPTDTVDEHALTKASAKQHLAALTFGVGEDQLEHVDVPSVPLTKLLDRHGWGDFDVLQVDAEGLDWVILQSLDFTRFRPPLIQFEAKLLSRHELTAATRTLNGLGYDVHYSHPIQPDAVALHRGWAGGSGNEGCAHTM